MDSAHGMAHRGRGPRIRYLDTEGDPLMWTWFEKCRESGFVNCWFKGSGGPCQNPKHQKS